MLGSYASGRVCCVGLELEEEKTEALGSQIFGVWREQDQRGKLKVVYTDFEV